jgi:hypothetical protein
MKAASDGPSYRVERQPDFDNLAMLDEGRRWNREQFQTV